MRKIVVLEPVAPTREVTHRLAPRPATLEGRRIGLLDDNKANADLLLNEVWSLLAGRFDLAEPVYRRKLQSPIPLSAEDTAALTACDAVILAICD